MFKKYFLLFLLGHVLGDFYTQTTEMAERKKNKLGWVFMHGLIYFLTFIVISIPFFSIEVILIDVVLSLLHLGIDITNYWVTKGKREKTKVFLIDQGLHIFCLGMIAYICADYRIPLTEITFVSNIFSTIGLSEVLVCKWLLGLLIIHKPANIMIQNLIGNYKPKTKVDSTEIKFDNNVGRVIGTVERVIMFILIYMNQYSATGLVLTAKSIARYNKIANEKDFAEYYLLGTLISLGIVIACAVLLFGA